LLLGPARQEVNPPGVLGVRSYSEGVMRFFAAFLALSLTACATQPVSIQQASTAPSSRILAPQWLSQAQYTGSLIIKRDTGFMGSACTIRVFVNTVPVADLAPSKKSNFSFPSVNTLSAPHHPALFVVVALLKQQLSFALKVKRFYVSPAVRVGTFTFSQARSESLLTRLARRFGSGRS
jgi:hypothetical protein